MAENDQYRPKSSVRDIHGNVMEVEQESAVDKARLQSAAGLGSMEKKGKGPMPKQNAGESASAYGARLRAWRESPEEHDSKVVGKAMEKLERK